MMASSTCAGSIPERSTAALTAIAPRSGAESGLSPPRNLPMGVRAPPFRMTGVVAGFGMAREDIQKPPPPGRGLFHPQRRPVRVGVEPPPRGARIVLEDEQP